MSLQEIVVTVDLSFENSSKLQASAIFSPKYLFLQMNSSYSYCKL